MIHKGNLHFPPYEIIRGIYTFSPYEIISGTAKNAVPPLWHHKGILFFSKKFIFWRFAGFFFEKLYSRYVQLSYTFVLLQSLVNSGVHFSFFSKKIRKKRPAPVKKKPLWGNWVLHSVCGKFHSNLNQSSKNTLNMPLFFPNIFHKIQ